LGFGIPSKNPVLFGNSPPTSSPIKTSTFGQVVNLQRNSFSWFRVVL
jgi:hypothetical protein